MPEEYINALYHLLWILFLSSFLFYAKKKYLIQSGKYLLIWFFIFLGTVIIYSYKDILLNNRVAATIFPKHGYSSKDKLVYMVANDKHFYINALINNSNYISFMVDTGASSIILSKKDALNLGIKIHELSYDKAFSTANGIIYCAMVKLESLKIKDLFLKNIYVAVNPHETNISLLGMSFLQYFHKYEFNQNSLTLYY
jgi:aspartyl protease family protein